MFQPRVKLAFVERYCRPADGWTVFVDIDASEEGRTGTWKTREAKARRKLMRTDGEAVRSRLDETGVHVGKRSEQWKQVFGQSFPSIEGDRDLIAVHQEKKRLLVVEVEGQSSGQPEQKLYKALGQAVVAVSGSELPGYDRSVVVAVHGAEIREHLRAARAMAKIGIAGVHVATLHSDDELVVSCDHSWFCQRWGKSDE